MRGVWRKLLNEQLHNSHSFLNIIRTISLRMMEFPVQLMCMGQREMNKKFSIEG